MMQPDGSIAQQRGPRRSAQDTIEIVARRRAEPCVKVGRHRHRPTHADIGRQVYVRTQDPGTGRTDRGGIEMDHLFPRMHSCVGAPRATDPDRVIGNLGNRLLEALLDGTRVPLNLPAAEGAAVVLYTHRESGRSVPLHLSRGILCGPLSCAG